MKNLVFGFTKKMMALNVTKIGLVTHNGEPYSVLILTIVDMDEKIKIEKQLKKNERR